MTTIRLHNTRTRRKEDFTPLDPNNVRMYVCGPTVYDRAHLGNGRAAVAFDVLYRLLRHVYGADHVTYVRNFTDVDDKINAEALRRRAAGATGSLEDLIHQRSDETIAWYHADMDALGALRPDHEPRATEYIGEMKDMIAELIEKKFAYAVPAVMGHNSRAKYVYLDSTRVPSHAFLSVDAFEERDIGYRYGELSGRSLEDMVVGSRAEVGEGKRNPMDSVLWKPSTIEEPGWESPWGFGRPGWHIECSAMSRKLLGKRFDIHGGGLDLLFPHHENELAQCTACDGPDASAQYWMHNEMLQVEGKKMSKSLGNFFTVRDLLDQGIPGEVIRFVLLSTHYGKPMDWTAEKAVQATLGLGRWAALVRNVEPSDIDPEVLMALSSDLNTPMALARLHKLYLDGEAGRLRASANLLGLLEDVEQNWTEAEGLSVRLRSARNLAERLGDKIRRARDQKDYATADAIRKSLVELGVKVSIDSTGVSTVILASAGQYFQPRDGQLQPKIHDELQVLTDALLRLESEYD
jgi:cysteinyl-tRNA synthetase